MHQRLPLSGNGAMQQRHTLLAGDSCSSWPTCCQEARSRVVQADQPAARGHVRPSREQDVNTSSTCWPAVGVASLSCSEHDAKARPRN